MVVPQFEEFLCAPSQLFAYFAVKKPLKQLTAKTAKNAKITQGLNLGHYARARLFEKSKVFG
jgi:hypothetical protein